MTSDKTIKNCFVTGAISPQRIADSIAHHQHKTNIGAHDIFLGQVRADRHAAGTVSAIEYSAYADMANEVLHRIREDAFSRFQLTCLHIYHSLGRVNTGEICLFVFTSSPHRASCFEATRWIVEEIKANVPVFGREIFENNTHQWKENK